MNINSRDFKKERLETILGDVLSVFLVGILICGCIDLYKHIKAGRLNCFRRPAFLLFSQLALIYFSTMTDCKNKNDNFFIFYFSNYSIIAYAITPLAGTVCS